MLTLLSNASTKYYPNNKPNSYKVLLTATLDLEGSWEVAIVNIQYPFTWPNLTEKIVALIGSVKESEVEKEKQREQQASEGDTPLTYFKGHTDSLISSTHWIPPPKSFTIMRMSMENKLNGSLTAKN